MAAVSALYYGCAFKQVKGFFERKEEQDLKKKFVWIIAAFLCLVLLSGCSGQAPTNDVAVDVEISEDLFVAQMRNVLDNFSNYEGQTIRFEGAFEYFGAETIFRSVMRRPGGC